MIQYHARYHIPSGMLQDPCYISITDTMKWTALYSHPNVQDVVGSLHVDETDASHASEDKAQEEQFGCMARHGPAVACVRHRHRLPFHSVTSSFRIQPLFHRAVVTLFRCAVQSCRCPAMPFNNSYPARHGEHRYNSIMIGQAQIGQPQIGQPQIGQPQIDDDNTATRQATTTT